mmetsp:Transcript_19154/g.16977  ORF Transcript_19154/g.16977 Transcript_19154/m.16977 type:complete len:129 (-) Transcript_19154:13-399(-)
MKSINKIIKLKLQLKQKEINQEIPQINVQDEYLNHDIGRKFEKYYKQKQVNVIKNLKKHLPKHSKRIRSKLDPHSLSKSRNLSKINTSRLTSLPAIKNLYESSKVSKPQRRINLRRSIDQSMNHSFLS